MVYRPFHSLEGGAPLFAGARAVSYTPAHHFKDAEVSTLFLQTASFLGYLMLEGILTLLTVLN